MDALIHGFAIGGVVVCFVRLARLEVRVSRIERFISRRPR